MKRSIKHIYVGIISLLCIGGMSACGESRTPDAPKLNTQTERLSAPENLYLEIHHYAQRTKYILTWNEDSRADGYTVEIDGVTLNTEEAKCELTRYFYDETKQTVKVTAVGTGNYESSAASEIECVAEDPTNRIDYQKSGEGYAVYSNSLDLSGRLVIPDYYADKKIVAVQDYAFGGETGTSAIRSAYFTSVRFPRGLKKIGEYAFDSCEYLKSVVIPDGVTECGLWAFNGCVRLKSATLSASMTEISSALFWGCEQLAECVFPENLTKIQAGAFSSTAFEEIRFPNTLAYIGDQAFSSCNNLKTVELSSTVELDENVFAACKSLENIFVEEGNPKYKSIDGNLYTSDGTTLLQYAAGKTAERFALPSGVTHIGVQAFAYAVCLKELEIPEGVLSIGEYAFAYCDGLTVLELPSTIEFVGVSAFSSAKNLETVILPNTVKSIWSGAFSQSKIKYLEIPEGVEKIEKNAFGGLGQKIDYIVIPKSMTDMQSAFPASDAGFIESIFNSLTLGSIYYKGTAEEWEQIAGSEYFDDKDTTVYYYSESEPPLSEDGTAYDGNYWYYDENGVPMVWTKEENGAQE
ncbi:MAG: leucine-rich repeat domain-containing protein [Clostridia bacterium]|nr:leucine-rich repeat domain-containing protein [Clostridia bacterium]